MRKPLHTLKKPRLRASWNKYNLYNLSRFNLPAQLGKTFYQQKWAAKAATRAYHGEQIREGKWTRQFTSRINSVIPMSHMTLAQFDGSEAAADSGSDNSGGISALPKTPYMNMTYAPVERRLDTAIFRALFASSVRQARQFVIHGAVKVNGRPLKHPGYMLNPGDMFQVEPDRVLYATGAPKGTVAAPRTEEDALPVEEAEVEEPVEFEVDEVAAAEADDASPATPLIKEASTLIKETDQSKLSAKTKQSLRALAKATKSLTSKRATVTEEDCTEVKQLLQEYKDKVAAAAEAPEEGVKSLKKAEGAVDPSKPYATPWRPRPYLSPFAFIPPYLEVNQNICSAVYLRHPVARPGMAEVPSPFTGDTHQLAYTWYLRRR